MGIKKYAAGIYARLSVEGKRTEGASEAPNGCGEYRGSIQSQIDIAKAYIASQPDISLSGCYIDV